jgi:hypothetical protein
VDFVRRGAGGHDGEKAIRFGLILRQNALAARILVASLRTIS